MYTDSMQARKLFEKKLSELADADHYLFSLQDLKCILPDVSQGAFSAMLSRCVQSGLVKRVCQGIYLYPVVNYPQGLVLYHTAARLRADEFNYLSLESVLSDAGVISQVPISWITLMSSGRRNTVNCSEFGNIEFIHTKKRPDRLRHELVYDTRCKLWRASVRLALKDMGATRRSTELVDWEVANELI